MKGMKVLLLGATGLLGHHVLGLLAERGFDVRVLVRRAGGLKVRPAGCEVMEGPLLDAATLRRAAAGCDAVVNCAGTTDMSLRRYADYLPVNRDLPALIVATMEAVGISTLVHVSTVNTIGYGTSDTPATESVPMESPFRGSFYADSKCEGESAVLSAAIAHPDWHVVVVCPGYMLGAFDAKPSSGKMLLAAYRRRLMFAPHGGKAFVPAIDVARATVNALTRGRHGAKYIVTHSHGCLTIAVLFALQARVMGYCQRVATLPDWLVRLAGRVGDLLRLIGIRTQLSSSNVRQLLVREFYDNSLALRELGYTESPIEQAIVDFHRWRGGECLND